jgi:hypothetical protein
LSSPCSQLPFFRGRVRFGEYAGNDIKIDDQEHLILREEEIRAKSNGIAKTVSEKK